MIKNAHVPDRLWRRLYGRPLGNREREVAALIAEGLSTKEIAHRLGISVHTVEAHRYTLMQKLGAHGVADVIRLMSHPRPVFSSEWAEFASEFQRSLHQMELIMRDLQSRYNRLVSREQQEGRADAA